MRFEALKLQGAFLVTSERHGDERGYFMRTWCQRAFAEAIGDVSFVQNSQSLTEKAGTIRGLHFQREPHGERKLIRCLRGRIYDVLVDLRRGSATFGRWCAVELAEGDGRAVYAPSGFAHGFQTLSDKAEVSYQISAFYVPEASAGIRWDDPVLAIAWPLPVAMVSARDASWPNLTMEHAA